MLHIRIHQQDLIVAIYLFLGQSDGHSLDLSRVGEAPHNIKFSGLRYLQVQVGAPKYLPRRVVLLCLMQLFGSYAVLWWKVPELGFLVVYDLL